MMLNAEIFIDSFRSSGPRIASSDNSIGAIHKRDPDLGQIDPLESYNPE